VTCPAFTRRRDSRRELLALHGVGPRAVTLLDDELIKRGIEPLRDN
jgi:hypothetical protein